jgi:hypothetical protein
MLRDPICILYCKQCMSGINVEDDGFPGLGFQGKNIYVIYVFSIVSFLLFY